MRRLAIPSGGIGGCGAGCARNPSGTEAAVAASPASEARLVSICDVSYSHAKSLASFGWQAAGHPRARQYSTSPRSRASFLNRSVLRTTAYDGCQNQVVEIGWK